MIPKNEYVSSKTESASVLDFLKTLNLLSEGKQWHLKRNVRENDFKLNSSTLCHAHKNISDISECVMKSLFLKVKQKIEKGK